MQGGATSPGGISTAASTPTQTQPTFNPNNVGLGVSPETTVGDSTVRAYVVSGDITSNQEAEAKLSTRRTISG